MRRTEAARAVAHLHVIRFVAAAAAWALGIFGLLRAPWFAEHAALPFTALQRSIAEWYGGRASTPVTVTLECSAIDLLALCAGVVLAYPTTWLRRARGLALVLPSLFLLNIFRIGTLSLAAGSPRFTLLHLYVWPALLTAASVGLVAVWLRSVGNTWAAGGRRALGAVYCLAGFAVVVPWLEASGLTSGACTFVATSASSVMNVLGAHASASGPILQTARGSFAVTPDCLISPIIPLWMIAVLWWPLTRPQRALGLALTIPVVATMAVARLLVLALPGALVSLPLVVVHGFHQVIVFVMVVLFTAVQGAPRPVSARRAAGRGLAAVAVTGTAALLVGPLYNAVLQAVMVAVSLVVPHALITLRAATDVQGALVLLPAYQLALVGAMIGVSARRVRPRDAAVAALVVVSCHVVLLALLGELAAHAGITPHALVLRGWAVAWPIAVALVVLRRSLTIAGDADTSYRQFWDDVGDRFPDLGGARSTRQYFEDERSLVTDHLGSLDGRRVLKTDLWDEAKNTRILQWIEQQGAKVFGIDIAGPIVRQAIEEFHGAPVGAAAGDVRTLPFADASFDAVYSMGTIEHFDETEGALLEIHRVLRPGGRAVIGVPNRHDPFLRPLVVALLSSVGLYPYGYEKSYSRRRLRRLLQDMGFEVVATDGILFVPGWLRMLDLVCHTKIRFLEPVVATAVAFFARLEMAIPWLRRHGYLVVAIAERSRTSPRFGAAGKEWIVDARGCDPRLLRSREILESLVAEIVDAAHLTPVEPAQWHVFEGGGGVTGLQMLSESHLSCHTYPEFGYAAFNLYSCRDRTFDWSWEDRLTAALGAGRVSVRAVPRSSFLIDDKRDFGSA